MNAVTRRLLLVEPQQMWRRTVASVLRDLGIAEVEECLRADKAGEQLRRQRYDALVISLDVADGGQAALLLLESLRAVPASRSLPVVVLAERCDAQLALQLQALQVHRLLLKPFKVRQVLLAVAAIWPGLVKAEELEPDYW